MKRDLLMLQNLNCPACAAQFEAAAQRLAGVERAKVSFAAGTLDVQYDPEITSQAEITGLAKRHGLVVGAVLPGGSHV